MPLPGFLVQDVSAHRVFLYRIAVMPYQNANRAASAPPIEDFQQEKPE